MKHLENLQSLSTSDLQEVLRVSSLLKERVRRGERPSLLSNYCLAQLFEKPSLRTRLSFDVAMTQLGGTSLFFSATDVGLNGRESLADVARVITRYADILVIRAFSQSLITEFAKYPSYASPSSYACSPTGSPVTPPDFSSLLQRMCPVSGPSFPGTYVAS